MKSKQPMSETLKALKSISDSYEEDMENLRKLPKTDLNISCLFYYENFLDQLEKVRESYINEIQARNS